MIDNVAVQWFLITSLEYFKMEQKFTTFAAAAKTYFGVRPGTGLKEFMAEVKELSDDDKAEIRKGMEAHGIIITS